MTAQWLLDRRAEWARCANLRTCPRCQATVLAGLDADAAAIPVRLDPTALTEIGEAVALLQGRATYDLVTVKAGREIHERTAHHINKPRRYSIFATHKCGQSLLAYISPPDQKAEVRNDDRPPF